MKVWTCSCGCLVVGGGKWTYRCPYWRRHKLPADSETRE